MNKKKNISNNYKDYKYVYTGYDEFIKSHHLDKKEIKKEKEKIVHDHRNVFDFDNPNQHYHDYSFDFNQNEQPKQTKTNEPYKDKYGNIYDKKPNIYQQQSFIRNNTSTTRTAPSKTQYSYNKTNINNNVNQKAVKAIIIIFFVLPFLFSIISIIVGIGSEFEYDDYDTTINYDEIIEEDNTSYLGPINAFCESLENNNFSYIWNYLTNEELRYDNGKSWRNIIYNYDDYGNINYPDNRMCGSKTATHLTESQIINLEKEFENKYNVTKTIDDAYRFYVTELINNSYSQNYYITIAKINNEWLLIKVQ